MGALYPDTTHGCSLRLQPAEANYLGRQILWVGKFSAGGGGKARQGPALAFCPYLDVCPPQQGVGDRGKPQGLSVVGVAHIVQHHLSGHAVDGQAQRQPARDDQGKHTNPDGNLQAQIVA